MNVLESPSHMLFECSNVMYNRRENLWQNVLQAAPEGMRVELRLMRKEEKTVYIMSGFKCDYIKEWSNLYSSMLDFCYTLYKRRQSINDGELTELLMM